MNTPTILMRGEIKFSQFVKLTFLTGDDAQARELTQAGGVTVNGKMETRHSHHLNASNIVEVDTPWGKAAAIVGSAS